MFTPIQRNASRNTQTTAHGCNPTEGGRQSYITKTWLPILAGVLLFILAQVQQRFFGISLTAYWINELLHFSGGVIVAWLFYRLFPSLPWHQLLVFVLGVGILWECAEWWGEVYGPTYWPLYAKVMRMGTPTDTVLDLVLDLSGGTVFALREQLLFRFRYAVNRLIG